jgi:penicillin-binding protein 1A
MGWDYVLPRTEIEDYGRIARPELGTEYFVDHVRRWLVESGTFTDAQIYGGGLRIYTTLDFDAQEAAMDAVAGRLGGPDDPQSSVVSIDRDGFVRAMVAGTDFEASQVNLATGQFGGGSGRQPGSSFKPIVLAEALRQGIPLETTFDSPGKITIDGADAGRDWVVGNYGDAGQGTLNLVDATRVSSNTAYAQLMMEVGPEPVSSLAARMGISAEVPAFPSIVLGTPEVSVLDMASAYSTFANSGVHRGPWVVSKVTDADGTILWEAPTDGERVLSEEVADTVSWVLHQVVERGTGKSARISQPVAGKTGTTDAYRDAWFVGYTCEMTTAVWVGYAGTETRYMQNVHGRKVAGGTYPAEIWHDYMAQIEGRLEPCRFERPATVSARLEQPSGTQLEAPVGTTPPSTTGGEESTTSTEGDGESTTTETSSTSSTSSSTSSTSSSSSSTSSSTSSTSSSSSSSTTTTTTPP